MSAIKYKHQNIPAHHHTHTRDMHGNAENLNLIIIVAPLPGVLAMHGMLCVCVRVKTLVETMFTFFLFTI